MYNEDNKNDFGMEDVKHLTEGELIFQLRVINGKHAEVNVYILFIILDHIKI